MSGQFDLYVVEDYVPVWIGNAENLSDAEKAIQSYHGGAREFLVYSQRTGVRVFYDRGPDGFILFRNLKHATIS